MYKYLRREHLLEFREKGSILVNTLYNLRFVDETIRDEFEGRIQVTVGSTEKQLVYSGEEFHQLFPAVKSDKPNIKIQFSKGTFVSENKQVSDAFVFCASLKMNNDLCKKFGYDAHYKITNPHRFAEILFERLNEVRMIRCFKTDKVQYRDKEIKISDKDTSLNKNLKDFWDICFTKPQKFHNEKEFRIVFVPENPTGIKPIVLACPELRKYCVV